MKEPMDKIRTICDTTPELGVEFLPSEARKLDAALTEIGDIALEACKDQTEHTSAVPVERNADGDTLEDIKRAWKNKQAIDYSEFGKAFWQRFITNLHFGAPVAHYRITAKHADKFYSKCMDFKVWARAAIDRGEIKRGRNGCIEIYDDMTNGYLHGRRCMPTSGHKVDYRIACMMDHSTWTAIPRLEMPSAIPSVCCGIGEAKKQTCA